MVMELLFHTLVGTQGLLAGVRRFHFNVDLYSFPRVAIPLPSLG